MQILRKISRINSLTNRSLFAKSDDIIVLEPGRYRFYSLTGGVVLKNTQLISSLALKKENFSIFNVQQGRWNRTLVLQEETSQKWVKFSDTGNKLVDTSIQATLFASVGFETEVAPPFPSPIPLPPIPVTAYILFTNYQFKQLKQIVPDGLNSPLHFVGYEFNPHPDPKEAIKTAFIFEKV